MLLREHGKERYTYRGDTVMQNLGYSSDNGGFYCCCTPYAPAGQQCNNPPPMNESYEATLLGVKNYSVAAQLPFHYILLDSWWYYRGDSGNVDIWDMRPTVFPRGLEHFASATGWSYQLHCGQKWSPQTHYSTRNGGAYNFVHDGSPTVVPDSQAFWDDLLANKTKDGMLTYEMDWMNDQMHQSKSMLTNEYGPAVDTAGCECRNGWLAVTFTRL